MTETTPELATREAQILYLTEWASRYGCCLQLAGEVGFGRECVGILKGDTYIDYAHETGIWTPEDAYHKHDCVAVLGRGDEALAQLCQWVKWLDENGWGVEEIYRKPSSDIDLALHGISLPRIVRVP
jgi:hypothetical protein